MKRSVLWMLLLIPMSLLASLSPNGKPLTWDPNSSGFDVISTLYQSAKPISFEEARGWNVGRCYSGSDKLTAQAAILAVESRQNVDKAISVAAFAQSEDYYDDANESIKSEISDDVRAFWKDTSAAEFTQKGLHAVITSGSDSVRESFVRSTGKYLVEQIQIVRDPDFAPGVVSWMCYYFKSLPH